MEPLRSTPYYKKRYPWLGTITRLSILSLLISLFVILLENYLLVMTEIPQTGDFKAVLSTMTQLQVWFGLRNKYHLEAKKLWWVSYYSSNGFRNNIRRKFPITMATTEYLNWMKTVKIVTTKVKLRVLRSWCPASECMSITCNPHHNIYVTYIHGAQLTTLDI